MPTSSSTPSTESLFRLGLNASLPISEEATTSRVVVNNDILRTVVFTFDAIYLAPGDRHALTAVTPCRMQLVMVDVDKVGAATEK